MSDKADLSAWVGPDYPDFPTLQGRYARLERLRADRHSADLFRANSESDAIWDYLPYGPFRRLEAYQDWINRDWAGQNTVFYAVKDLEKGHFSGVASYLRIKPQIGVIEVGHINFSPALQRSRAATEAMYLMMRWVFEAGYRRYEWKCDAANRASRAAAQRLGFSYEGIFRQAAIVKGRNRDTAWFAMIDREWPALNAAFQHWLSPENFDTRGRQIKSLSDLTCGVLVAKDPQAG